MSRSIGEPLALGALDRIDGALHVVDSEADAIGIAEVEFGEVAMQMTAGAMLVNAGHAALEDAEIAFDSVGSDHLTSFVASVFLGIVVDGVMGREIPAERLV